ncbi:hypothetical protein CB1_000357028 [Camelus ferus]|nr:hypothetical protein CB1_000357028 [Camelus ferus]
MTLSSREEKEVDIVRMLARAKDEYTKVSAVLPPLMQARALSNVSGEKVGGDLTWEEWGRHPGPLCTLQQQRAVPPLSRGVSSSHLTVNLFVLFITVPQTGGDSAGSGVSVCTLLFCKISTCSVRNCKTCSEPKPITSSPAVCHSPSLIKPVPLKPGSRPQRLPRPSQVLSPQRVPAAAAPSLLMSPMVFTQHAWAPPQDRASGLLPLRSQDPAATPTGLLLPLQPSEPPGVTGSPLTKLQLQEALLHLVQAGEARDRQSSSCPFAKARATGSQHLLLRPLAAENRQPSVRPACGPLVFSCAPPQPRL